MKVIALLVLCTFSDVAIAQTSQCQSIPKASDRLACYDKATPPTAVGKPAAPKAAAPDNAATSTPLTGAQGAVIDMVGVENSKLDAKIKTICRGC